MLLKTTFFSMLAMSVAAQGAEPDSRAPTGKWTVDFDAAQCVAVREYGTPDRPLRLFLKAPPVGDVIQMGVTRKASRADAAQIDATVAFGDLAPIETNLLLFSPRSGDMRIYLLNLPAAGFRAAIPDAKSVTIRASGFSETFALTQMGALLKVMDGCVEDLKRTFNIGEGAATPGPLARRARGDIRRHFDPSLYPAEALRAGQSGNVRIVLLIDEQGRVADCTITETSGFASLDAQTCAVLREKARLEPAQDSEGKAVKDSVTTRVRWITEK
jgi:TonB family protein